MLLHSARLPSRGVSPRQGFKESAPAGDASDDLPHSVRRGLENNERLMLSGDTGFSGYRLVTYKAAERQNSNALGL
jgi:hypothetical protein